MRKLSLHNPNKVIDYLCERLAVERTGAEFYSETLRKMAELNDPEAEKLRPQLLKIRDEELQHAEWLEAQILTLGGDLQDETELASLVRRESEGILNVVKGDMQPAHLFHALLMVELMDNAGWEMLLHLADEAGDDEAREEFSRRAREEQQHLMFVRQVVTTLARDQVLGAQQPIQATL